MSPPEVRLRRAARDDAPWLASLWASAFPGPRTAQMRLRELRADEGRYGGLETCWVGERDGERVGALRCYPFRMSIWGRDVPVQGLAAVAVAPEFRRQGLGHLLCRHAIRQGRSDGQLLSVLYPFRVDFYSRLGYTLAGELHRYEVAPEEFPLFAEGRRVRALPPEEAAEAVPRFYERVRTRTQGLLRRSSRMWEFLRDPSLRAVVVPAEEGGDLIRGYLVTEALAGRMRRGDVLRVRESVVEDLEAHRALLGWISLQRDQWRRIVYDALPGEHLERLLGHPRRERARGTRPGALWFPSASILRGPMLRILDMEEVLRWVGPPAGATLRVADDVVVENDGTWEAATGSQPAEGEPEGGDAAGALPIALVTELFLDGALPGQRDATSAWRPLLGIEDFRLLDTF